jgi:predicted lipid-binding transport protein (Tim44 family)
MKSDLFNPSPKTALGWVGGLGVGLVAMGLLVSLNPSSKKEGVAVAAIASLQLACVGLAIYAEGKRNGQSDSNTWDVGAGISRYQSEHPSEAEFARMFPQDEPVYIPTPPAATIPATTIPTTAIPASQPVTRTQLVDDGIPESVKQFVN